MTLSARSLGKKKWTQNLGISIVDFFKSVTKIPIRNSNVPSKLLGRFKDFITVPRYKHAQRFIRFVEGFEEYLSSLLAKNTYDAIYVYGSSTYGYHFSGIEGQNITCDVVDSSTLCLSSLLKSEVKMRKNFGELASLAYDYFHNLRLEKRPFGFMQQICRDLRERQKDVEPLDT